MRLTISLTTAFAVCVLSTPAAASPTAKHSGFQLTSTTWTFVDKKDGKLKESIDADGNYITQTIGGKHIDHGKALMKGSKACFTSAMSKAGEMCWTTSPVKIGHSMVTTNDKGRKLKVTRLGYAKLSMPE